MIEQATVHPSHADTDINLPVSIYLVHLSSPLDRGSDSPSGPTLLVVVLQDHRYEMVDAKAGGWSKIRHENPL